MAKITAAKFLAEHEDKIKARGKCKLWTGARNSKGYAKATINGKQVLVHRHVLELKLGRPLRKNMHCAHKCNNRNCVAPHHLREATQSENEKDKSR